MNVPKKEKKEENYKNTHKFSEGSFVCKGCACTDNPKEFFSKRDYNRHMKKCQNKNEQIVGKKRNRIEIPEDLEDSPKNNLNS